MAPKVTEEVFRQYQDMQIDGSVNMLNAGLVQSLAMDNGYLELVSFIDDGDYYEELVMKYKYHKKRFE